jgi:broad specificity phosphatase PhoE
VTTFLLIRHATNDLVGNAIAGRLAGVHLNAAGRKEAQRLVERLADTAIAAIYASPRERAQETAAPLAAQRAIPVQTSANIDEVDFGEWTGRAFRDLESEPQWRVWVEQRSAAVIPDGERLVAVQQRFSRELERLALGHPEETIALVSHGEPIKTALAHVLALSLDHLDRFDIAPASVSVVVLHGAWAQVRLINGIGKL